jgi:hypothetical protein
MENEENTKKDEGQEGSEEVASPEATPAEETPAEEAPATPEETPSAE